MSALKKASGPLLMLSFVLTVLSTWVPGYLDWIPGTVTWVAGGILFFSLRKAQKKPLLVIAGLAILSWLVAWQAGEIKGFAKAFSNNQLMITMLIGVHFLQLVALPQNEKIEPSPTGFKAFLRTYLWVHLFGSVINVSAVLLVADRCVKKAQLSMNQLKLLIRAFTSAAHWSPFFAAFAAALVFTPEASLPIVMGVGISMAIVAFYVTLFEVKSEKKELIKNFIGYPMHFDSLWLPASLVVLVGIAHTIIENVSVLILIAVCSLLLSMAVLLVRNGPAKGGRDFIQHGKNSLPQMKNELLLFLIAGVFGSGLAAALDGLSIAIPFDYFDGEVASVILLCMFLLAILGVHPVISIAVVGHWIVNIEPNQTLLAIMFLMAWAVGVSASPLSGINLALQGRYGASGQKIFKWNIVYAIKLYLLDCLVLLAVSHWLGV